MQIPTQNSRKTTWRQLINTVRGNHDPFNDQPHMVDEEGQTTQVTDEWLDTPFVNSYGRTEARPFILWTNRRIYFPINYDGMVVVASVPRTPHPYEKHDIIDAAQIAAKAYNLSQPGNEPETGDQ